MKERQETIMKRGMKCERKEKDVRGLEKCPGQLTPGSQSGVSVRASFMTLKHTST